MKNSFVENSWACHVPDRNMDEPFFVFDFAQIVKKIKAEEAWKNGDRNALTLLKNSYVSVVLISLKKTAEINFHHSGRLASVQILKGALHFKTNNNSTLIKTGSLLTLHEQVAHMLVAVEESVILLTITGGNLALSPA
jgi:quercetin dioxygenase-like cupin family protein